MEAYENRVTNWEIFLNKGAHFYLKLSAQANTSNNPAQANASNYGTVGNGDEFLLESGSLEGMNYSLLLENFVRFLHGGDITFIGGPFNPYYAWSNVVYTYDRDTGERKEITHFQDYSARDDGRFLGNSITTQNPVIIIPLHATYLIGERYPVTGQKITSIPLCGEVVARDTRGVGTNAYCKISKEGEYDDADVTLFNVRTPAFTLNVPHDSVLADRFEIPVEAGNDYMCVAAARMAVFPKLREGSYRIWYGGRGTGGYYCDTVLDLMVGSYSIPEPVPLGPPSSVKGILDLSKSKRPKIIRATV